MFRAEAGQRQATMGARFNDSRGRRDAGSPAPFYDEGRAGYVRKGRRAFSAPVNEQILGPDHPNVRARAEHIGLWPAIKGKFDVGPSPRLRGARRIRGARRLGPITLTSPSGSTTWAFVYIAVER